MLLVPVLVVVVPIPVPNVPLPVITEGGPDEVANLLAGVGLCALLTATCPFPIAASGEVILVGCGVSVVELGWSARELVDWIVRSNE